MQDCPLFNLQTEDQQRQCKLKVPPTLASEKVTGMIGDSLPGGVVVQYGPGPAIGNKPQTQSVAVPVPTVTYTPGTTVTGSDYLPGGVFKETPTSSPSRGVNALVAQASSSTSSTSSPPPPPPPPPPATTAKPTTSDAPPPAGYELVRTDFVTNGNVVSKIVVIETVEYVMMTTETVTVTATFGGDKARRQLHHLHQHRRGSH